MKYVLRLMVLTIKSTQPVQVLTKRILHKDGHTFVEAIISLGVMLILASLVPLLLSPIQKHPPSIQLEETSVFLSMLGKEVREGKSVEIRNNGLYITQTTGDVLSFTKYHSLIRKQVNGLGHEVWVQNIQEMLIEKQSDTSLKVTVIDTKGKELMRVFRRLK
ncbi:ComGF family competence protein [Fictibacillus sp. UD]